MQEPNKPDLFIGNTLFFSLGQTSVIAVLASMVLDGGGLFQSCAYGGAAYWIGFFIITVRRLDNLTRTDRFMLRWGLLILLVVSFFLTRWIWSLRGYPGY